MNEKVTVDEALAKGHRMVNYPILLIMFGTVGLGFFLRLNKILPGWIIPVGFALGFALGWLWWSIMITKWRIWAFANVRNVHELKSRAIQEKLIWGDDSIFEKTEIRTTIDKQRLSSIQSKFEREDSFIDDSTVRNETMIFYSKSKTLVQLIIMLGCLSLGVYLILTTDNYFVGAVLSLIGAYSGFKNFKAATNCDPQIVINDKGIKTVSTKFYGWNEIEGEEVKREGSGRTTSCYLVYSYPGGVEHLSIDDYDINMPQLNKLLILNRGRYGTRTTEM